MSMFFSTQTLKQTHNSINHTRLTSSVVPQLTHLHTLHLVQIKLVCTSATPKFPLLLNITSVLQALSNSSFVMGVQHLNNTPKQHLQCLGIRHQLPKMQFSLGSIDRAVLQGVITSKDSPNNRPI
jgi:hypothetical protein